MRLSVKRLPELIHQTYEPSGPLAPWMENVARLVGEIVGIPDASFICLRYTSGYAEHRYDELVSTGPKSRKAAEGARAMEGALPPPVVQRFFNPLPICVTQSEIERTGFVSEGVREVRNRSNAEDALGLRMAPEPGVAACISVLLDRPTSLSPHERLVLSRVALHVETALRLRLRPEAVRMAFDPKGRLLYDTVGQGDFVATVREVEGARSDAAARLALWTALVHGRYSLVEREDRGKRLYLLLENPPERRAQRRLTRLELAVLRRASRGMSGKMIAYSLGVASSTVSTCLSAAAHKLGLASSVGLTRLARGLLETTRSLDDAKLSTAERAVLTLLLEGKSNLEIAQERRRSDRTVANQVASILRKTGATSRRSL